MNPRSITDAERPWLADWTLARRAELKAAALDVGHSRTIVSGLLDWLDDKHAGIVDSRSMGTRARYRAILRALPAPNGEPIAIGAAARRPAARRRAGRVDSLGRARAVAASHAPDHLTRHPYIITLRAPRCDRLDAAA